MSATFIRGVMRRLRRRFSRSVELMNPGTTSRDLDSGAVSRSYTRKTLQAIVLPMKEERDFVYDLSYIAANKNFTYGGTFEIERVNIIIDTVVLTTFKVDKHTVVMINGQPHTVEKITREWAGDHYVMVQAKRTEEANIGRVGVTPLPATAAVDTQNPTVT